jgi:nucleotide-binding universal stress UspA family protein
MRIEPKKIMCAIDFSDFSNMVLSYGKALAKEFDSKLCLCHVISGIYMVPNHMPAYVDYTNVESNRMKDSKERLEKMADELGIDCEVLILVGNPADEIEHSVRDNNIDMVIAATHGGSGIKRFLIGSVTNRLVKILSCPMMVLHPMENHKSSLVKQSIKLESILVGCDFSPDSKLALDYALSLAQEFQTQIYLAHVTKSQEQLEFSASQYVKLQPGDALSWNRPDHLGLKNKETGQHIEKSSILARLERQLLNMVPEDCKNWCQPVTVMLEGQPYKELLNYAEQKNVDMIVLGVRGHSLLEQFLIGSTTDRVISRASCPVLTVRQNA